MTPGALICLGAALMGVSAMLTYDRFSRQAETTVETETVIHQPKPNPMRRTTSMAALPSPPHTDLGSPKLNKLEELLATTSKCAHCGGKLANRKTYVVGRERGDSLQFCSSECRKEACGWNK